MATMTLTIPDAQLARVLTAVCSTYGYDASKGQTQAAFARQKLIEYVMAIVQAYEVQQAVATAQQAAISGVQSGVTLT